MNSSANKQAGVDKSLPFDKGVTVRSLLESTGVSSLLAQPGVTELAINRAGEIWTEGRDGWICHAAPQATLDALKKLANALVVFKGDHLSLAKPIHPVRLPDGQRGQVLIAPAVEPDTVSMTMRVPSAMRLSMADYERSGSLKGFADSSPKLYAPLPDDMTARGFIDASPTARIPTVIDLALFELAMIDAKASGDIGTFLALAIENKLNIVTVGGTGSGKTTLMKALADLVPPRTRVGTIEDTHELALPLHPNRVHMFYSDALPAKEIVRSTLRMKFDRVFLAELRGDETWDYLTLLNTGHQGGMTSVHANDCISAFSRITTLVKASTVGQTLDLSYIAREVKVTIDVVLFMENKRLKEVYFDPVGKWKLQRGLA
jgi:type IV secretion system protein VirB11